MFVLSLTIYEIFTNKIKCQIFDLENGNHQGLAQTTWQYSILNWCFLIRILFTRQPSFYPKGNGHKFIHRVIDRGNYYRKKNCKADLPKKDSNVVFQPKIEFLSYSKTT